MADLILTPELLMQQSAEMINLQGEYETLFKNVNTSLSGINESWSENLAKNFSGKIQMAQGSFSSVTNMFANGGNAAGSVARTFENGISASQALNTAIGDTMKPPYGYTAGGGGYAIGGGGKGAFGGGDSGTSASNSGKNPSTAKKAHEVANYYSKEARAYQNKASEALKSGEWKKAYEYEKKAIESATKATNARLMETIAIPVCMLGGDNPESVEAFEKAMSSTPIIKHGYEIGKGAGEIVKGNFIEGGKRIIKNIAPAVSASYGDGTVDPKESVEAGYYWGKYFGTLAK